MTALGLGSDWCTVHSFQHVLRVQWVEKDGAS